MAERMRMRDVHNDIELLFQGNPRAGICFLRPLLIAGCVSSIFLTSVDTWALVHRADSSSRLAILWVIAQVVLQTCQLPLRVLLLRRVRAADASPTDAAAGVHLLELNRSSAWFANKWLGMANFFWFATGVLLVAVQAMGNLQRVILVHIGLFIVRCLGTLIWFTVTFDDQMLAGQVGQLWFRSKASREANARSITANLPQFVYGDSNDLNSRYEMSE